MSAWSPPHPALRATFSRWEKEPTPVTTRRRAMVQLHYRSARMADEKNFHPVNPIRCAGPLH